MKVILVDDELDALEALSIMLTEFIRDVEIVATATSALEAVKLINTKKPDLVFLDVEMPYANGFDVLDGVTDRDFQVIFVTAYEHYAIKAIKVDAVDYLMKPIDVDDLDKAIERAKERLNEVNHITNDTLLDKKKEKILSKIPIYINGEYLLIDIENIQYIKSEGSYSHVNTFDKVYLTTKNLGSFEEVLSGCNFLRISNSSIINLDKIRSYLKEDGGTVVLQNKAKIAVSRNKKSKLKELLNIKKTIR